MTDRDTDPETLRAIAEQIDRLNDAAARLRTLGEAADLPAVERNAERVRGVATTLSDNVPPELVEE